MKKLSPEEFRDSLQKGLGRAVGHVRAVPAIEVREDLLHASLNCLRYDPFCEDTRTAWFMKMYQATGEPEFYRRSILDRLLELSNDAQARTDYDFGQLYELAAEFAMLGDQEARNVVYQVFDKTIHDEWIDCGGTLVRIDGIDGLLHVVRTIGQRILDGFGFQNAKYDIEEAEEMFGEENVQNAIQSAANDDTLIQTYLERASSEEPWFDHPSYNSFGRPPRLPLRDCVDSILEDDFADFKDYGEEYDPYYCLTSRRSWVRIAAHKTTQEELCYAMNALVETTNPMRQFCLLGAFVKHPMPWVERTVIDLVDSENESLCWSSVQALASTSHEWIREKALEFLESEPQKTNWCDGVEMLEHSFQSGDQDVIEKAIRNKEFPDIHAIHGTGLAVSRLLKIFPDDSFQKICRWFYDQTPCSSCRSSFVEHLIQHNALPPEMLEECREDGCENIRELVAELS